MDEEIGLALNDIKPIITVALQDRLNATLDKLAVLLATPVAAPATPATPPRFTPTAALPATPIAAPATPATPPGP